MIAELLLSVASGGMTGILGGGPQLLFGWLNTRARIEERKAETQAQKELILARAEAHAKGLTAEAEGKAAVAEAQALAASQESFKRSYLDGIKPPQSPWLRGLIYFLMGCMETFRASIRPGLTVYLIYICHNLYQDTQKLLKDVDFAFRPEDISMLYVQIVLTFLYLLTTCVSWWFVTRNKMQPVQLKAPGV